MRILLVAATEGEAAPLLRSFSGGARHNHLAEYTFRNLDLDVLITGVGMVATAAWGSRTLAARSYGLALNIGLCGAFDRRLDLGQVVHITSDRIVELGAEDGERFLPLEELGLLDRQDVPYARAELVNESAPPVKALLELTSVKGITVNTVHGDERSIAMVIQRCQPQVESMEGAAFMYACMIAGVPFAQVRAVSNIVEKRNRAAWRIGDALKNLAATTMRILEGV